MKWFTGPLIATVRPEIQATQYMLSAASCSCCCKNNMVCSFRKSLKTRMDETKKIRGGNCNDNEKQDLMKKQVIIMTLASINRTNNDSLQFLGKYIVKTTSNGHSHGRIYFISIIILKSQMRVLQKPVLIDIN